jgi:hypothetical protein
LSIREARRRIRRILQDSPSLVPYVESVFEDCYQDTRGDAAAETGMSLEVFPAQAPFPPDDVRAPGFLPD